VFAVACGLVLIAVDAQAQSPERNPNLDQRQGELRGVEDDLRLSDKQRRKIEAEVELIRSDRARLSAALLATASRVQGLEARASDVEKRLEASLAGEAAIRRSLDTRRNTIAEILAALQRIGRKPPPAILVT
jgi:septal ring factor EnvC (AmiA/AmiB activator)